MMRVLVIPAAGTGSRLRTSLPKLLVPVDGRAMVDHLFHLYARVVSRFVLIVHPSVEALVRQHCTQRNDVDFAVQPEPTGMLDAMLIPQDHVRRLGPDSVWITWCDQIGVHSSTVAHLAAATVDRPAVPLILPVVTRRHPYTLLERDERGRITAVRHRREGDVMPQSGESEMGLFALSLEAYTRLLPEYAAGAPIGRVTGERSFLPFIPWLADRNEVRTFPAHDEFEAVGVNTPEELAQMEAYVRAHRVSVGER